MDQNETQWDRLLKIKTTGRDDSHSDQYRYPYEPTQYCVLERLAHSGLIGKKNVLLDYGTGKGRVCFYLSYQTPSVPIVLGMVLGPIAESNLRNALVMSNGSWTIFVKRPICLAFIILTFVLIVLLKKGDAKQRKATDKYMKGEQEE